MAIFYFLFSIFYFLFSIFYFLFLFFRSPETNLGDQRLATIQNS